MGENSKIAWCDDTFNPWWGCQRVSPGCDNCYAKTLANRWGYGHMYSLPKRRFFSDNHWNEPILWNKEAAKNGVNKRVFCASMGDVFDDPFGDYETACMLNSERDRLWQLILKTPYLDWLILTKRPENIQGLIYHKWSCNNNLPDNVRIGITCENQEMYDKRVPVLLDAWQGKNFISYEPALSLLHLGSYGYKIDWLIAGCESGTSARPCKTEWMQILRDQTSAFDIPFFLKQLVIDGKLTVEPELDGKKWLEFPEK